MRARVISLILSVAVMAVVAGRPAIARSLVEVEAAFAPPAAAPGSVVTLTLTARIAAGYHIYAPDSPADAGIPTSVEYVATGGLTAAGDLSFTEPVAKWDEIFEVTIRILEGEVVLRQGFRVPADATGEITVRGILHAQVCDDATCSMEDPAFRALLAVTAGPGEAGPPTGPDTPPEPPTGSSSATAPPAAPVEGGESLQSMSLGAFLFLAVFWGLVTLLMPCTYPMIPITISFFTKQAIAREGRVLPLSVAYGAGIVLIFILIGVVLGAPIITFAQHPVTNLVIGLLFVFFALVLFGIIDLQPPRFLLDAAGKASAKGGLVGVFLMGATLVVTSFTCTAPFVGSLLSVGAGKGDIGRIVLGMGVFGLTMATPFVFLSLVPGRLQRMPRAGEWMHVLKVFLGFVELAAALKFFSNSDLVWGWGILSREVFLVLAVGILFTAAAFLFGWIHLQGESERDIGPVRMLGGLCTLLLSLYLSLGVLGFVLDDITTAIIPNYSNEKLFGAATEGAVAAPEHTIVKDDYVTAARLARDQDRLLLLNFTGFS